MAPRIQSRERSILFISGETQVYCSSISPRSQRTCNCDELSVSDKKLSLSDTALLSGLGGKMSRAHLLEDFELAAEMGHLAIAESCGDILHALATGQHGFRNNEALLIQPIAGRTTVTLAEDPLNVARGESAEPGKCSRIVPRRNGQFCQPFETKLHTHLASSKSPRRVVD